MNAEELGRRAVALSHDELVSRVVRWLRKTRGCGVAFAEIVTYAPLIPDAIGWKWGGGECHLVECKTSRSDFKADEKKQHKRWGRTPGSQRWYFTEPGLVKPEEMPEGWGLVEVHEKSCRVKLDAPRHHEDRCMRSENAIMFSALRRHAIGVPFNRNTGRFKTVEAAALEAKAAGGGE